jgi:hypothetical protein
VELTREEKLTLLEGALVIVQAGLLEPTALDGCQQPQHAQLMCGNLATFLPCNSVLLPGHMLKTPMSHMPDAVSSRPKSSILCSVRTSVPRAAAQQTTQPKS